MLASCLFCPFLTEAMEMVLASVPCDSWGKAGRKLARTGKEGKSLAVDCKDQDLQ